MLISALGTFTILLVELLLLFLVICQAPGFVEGGYLASTRSSTGSGDGSTAACLASYSAGGT